MNKNKLPSIKDDFTSWYQEVVSRAELAEHAPAKGCMTIRPYGYAIWENIRDELNLRIKRRGVENVSFPLFIPMSYLAREKDHIDGFSPEIAVVTYAGGDTLQEELVVRPTSETIIHESMSRWIQSYRDLPLRINQWCNVVRWEKHPRLFLRSTEFQWQEGHTAHATEAEAHQEVFEMLQLYHDFVKEVLAIPTVMGKKSEQEKFAGAVESYSIEGLMPDGKALQMGTVHYLGENFSKMADVNFLDEYGSLKFAQMTSWGVSTRLIGALIMVHGDDKGLVVPPRIAPVQVIIIPVDKAAVNYATTIKDELVATGVRANIDNRDNIRIGAKFYEHEIRGIPIRLEIGAREIKNSTVTLVTRYNSVKTNICRNDIAKTILSSLSSIQEEMIVKAERKLNSRTVLADTKENFSQLINEQSGMITAPWCCEDACEASIKKATGAVSRNLSIAEQSHSKDCCIWCGKPARSIAYFAKAY